MPSSANRVAFVVEGTYDQVVVNELARRIWGERIDTHTVRLGGSAALPWIWSVVLSLLDEKHYAYVVLVLDADTVDPREVEEKCTDIARQLRHHRIEPTEFALVMAVPELEAWLLADEVEDPEQMQARELYRRIIGDRRVDDMKQRARGMDLDRAASRSPSLATFLSTLHKIERDLQGGAQPRVSAPD